MVFYARKKIHMQEKLLHTRKNNFYMLKKKIVIFLYKFVRNALKLNKN